MSIHRHGHRPEITVVREPDRAPEADLSLRRPAPGAGLVLGSCLADRKSVV